MSLFGGLFTSESQTANTTNLSDNKRAASGQAVQDNTSIGRDAVGQGGSQIRTGGGALSIDYSSDPEILRDAIHAVSNQSDRFAESLTDIFAASTDATNAQALANAVSQRSLLEQTFAKLADLAKSSQSGGETDRNKIVLYVSLAALAVVAILFFNRR